MHFHRTGKFRIRSVEINFCVFSALLATASYDTQVILWSTITGEILKTFAHKIPIPLKIYAGGDNGAFVRSVVITKYNHNIITACDDKYEPNSDRHIDMHVSYFSILVKFDGSPWR